MSQFFANLLHSMWGFAYSPYWDFGKVLLAVDMTILLGFFGNFYIKKYLTPQKGVQKKTDKIEKRD